MIFKMLKRMNERNRIYNELAHMSNKELADIGISRYDIRAVARAAVN